MEVQSFSTVMKYLFHPKLVPPSLLFLNVWNPGTYTSGIDYWFSLGAYI